MNQHYDNGLWLRDRYRSLFNEEYLSNFIYFRSTDVDRTLASAYSLLAGMFPPFESWDPSLSNMRWQPIPVHTVPEADDYILTPTLPKCPAFEKELARIFTTKEIIDLFKDHETIINEVLLNAGFSTEISNFYKMLYLALIRDNLYIEYVNGKT